MDGRNNLGHPTKKCDMIRRKLRQGKAKVIRRMYNTMLVQLTDVVFSTPKCDCKFIMGIDPGYQNIGYYIIKVHSTNTIDGILGGEVTTRTSQIKELLLERKMYRNNRRSNRRSKVLRKYGKAKFRHPIWKNRKKHKFQPTHHHLINTHINLVNKIHRFIPIDEIDFEYFKFDSQKIQNPSIQGWQYQRGEQYNFENVKSYVRCRDGYTCQICRATQCQLQVHHIIHRSKGGIDIPSNLISLCPVCHSKVHASSKSCPQPSNIVPMRDSGVLNSCIPEIYSQLQNLNPNVVINTTYGYITKGLRFQLGYDKSHMIDAFMCSLSNIDIDTIQWGKFPPNVVNFKQFRRHNRAWTSRYEDRKYYLFDQKTRRVGRDVEARNRHKRSGQEERSLQEYRKVWHGFNRKYDLIAKPGGKILKKSVKEIGSLAGNNIPLRIGNQFVINGRVETMTSTASTQNRVYCKFSQSSKDYVTFGQLRNQSRHLLCNTGLVSL